MGINETQTIRIILVLFAGLFLMTGIAVAETVRFVPQEISVKPGETATVDLVLSDAPEGLSGYRTLVIIDTSGIAEITAVTFPEWAEFTGAEGIPGVKVKVTGVDLNGMVERNAKNVVLATLTIRGISEGNGIIGFEDAFFDDNRETRIVPDTENGTVVVSATPAVTATTSPNATATASTNATGTVSTSTTTIVASGIAASGGSGSSSGSSGTVMTTGPTLSVSGTTGTIGQVTTLPAQQTQEAGGMQVSEITTTGTTISSGAESPAGPGIPFLSIPGMAVFLATLVIMAVWFRKREDGN
ncbi:MAG: hypothetical protein MUE45_02760 [Methanoregulaceae archaeon]|jgi:hypothetical protein|nr:hypothetical protein [Methanoregulaceae archaeon]